MKIPDKALVKRIQKGNHDSFKELYLRYSDLLYAFISHQLNNDIEATSDIWQETWIIAVEKIAGFHYKSSVFTWLCAIAKNKISDYFRLKEKVRKFNHETAVYIDIDNEETNTVNDNIKEEVLAVLADLSADYRYLLTERYFENKSVEEISHAIDKSYKATESLLSRSREAFRKRFKQIQESKL